jgi:hypothetical protein
MKNRGVNYLCKLVHNAPMNTSTIPQKVRLTITVPADVHQVFQRLAKASSMPTGRAMGDWLTDTIDAAEFMATNMERARAAPKLVAQELHAYALGLSDEMGDIMQKLREKGTEDRAKGALAHSLRHASPTTPPSNTGVTTTKNKPTRGTK